METKPRSSDFFFCNSIVSNGSFTLLHTYHNSGGMAFPIFLLSEMFTSHITRKPEVYWKQMPHLLTTKTPACLSLCPSSLCILSLQSLTLLKVQSISTRPPSWELVTSISPLGPPRIFNLLYLHPNRFHFLLS